MFYHFYPKVIQNYINKRNAERQSRVEIVFKKLNSAKKIFEKDSLEHMVDYSDNPVVGNEIPDLYAINIEIIIQLKLLFIEWFYSDIY